MGWVTKWRFQRYQFSRFSLFIKKEVKNELSFMTIIHTDNSEKNETTGKVPALFLHFYFSEYCHSMERIYV